VSSPWLPCDEESNEIDDHEEGRSRWERDEEKGEEVRET
jgi:hypothetical protein